MGAKPTIHIVFTMSSAGGVRLALDKVGCAERVIGFPDNLSFGPINPPSASLRQQWVERSLGYDWDEVVSMGDLFWAEATSLDTFPVAWWSRHDAKEYSGFLEFVWRMADAPFRVVDATVAIARHGQPGTYALSSLSLANPTQIEEAHLPDRQRMLQGHEIEDYRAKWLRLRGENAPLRIVDETGLVSAPFSYFDDVVLSSASAEWQKGSRVVGNAMAMLMDRPLDQ